MIKMYLQAPNDKRINHFTLTLPAINGNTNEKEKQQASIHVLDISPHNRADGRAVTLGQGNMGVI